MRMEGGVGEVTRLFLRLGITGFGGPAAHVALMEDECVRVRGWVSREEFADLLAAANVLPGPSSTELAMMLGYRRAGRLGLVAAGIGFIMPAVILVWLFAWWYQRAGAKPRVSAMLAGMQPVVVAVVLQAVWRLGSSVVKGWPSALIVAGSFVALMMGVNELVVLAVASTVCVGMRAGASASERSVIGGVTGSFLSTSAATVTVGGATAGGLFASCLKIGFIVFGSGYVLLAYIRAEFVQRHGWLSEGQLLDAIAIGQVTPGPVFSTATFVGYLVAGHVGAAAATVGIFLPAFLFAAGSGAAVSRLRRSPRAQAALDGVNAASLALLAMALVLLARDVVATPYGAVVAPAAFALLMTTRVGAGWILSGGAALGILRAMVW